MRRGEKRKGGRSGNGEPRAMPRAAGTADAQGPGSLLLACLHGPSV